MIIEVLCVPVSVCLCLCFCVYVYVVSRCVCLRLSGHTVAPFLTPSMPLPLRSALLCLARCRVVKPKHPPTQVAEKAGGKRPALSIVPNMCGGTQYTTS